MKAFFQQALCWLCLLSFPAQAFELADLQQQMQQAPVVRGSFVQEKYIKGLAQPLQSRGTFSLLAGKGLLWNLSAPLEQSLRISAEGVAQRVMQEGKAKWLPSAQGQSQQNALFLAVLRGDTKALQQQFALSLSGAADDWQLTLTPKSALLQQIFTQIQISGGELLSRIELFETSGERTRILLQAVKAATPTPEEEQAFAG